MSRFYYLCTEVSKANSYHCKKQKKEEGKTKFKVLFEISPQAIDYVDNLKLQKKYTKTTDERKTINILEEIFGKHKLPPKDLVSNEVLLSIGDFKLVLDKKVYFKLRDCIINSEKKLRKITKRGKAR